MNHRISSLIGPFDGSLVHPLVCDDRVEKCGNANDDAAVMIVSVTQTVGKDCMGKEGYG